MIEFIHKFNIAGNGVLQYVGYGATNTMYHIVGLWLFYFNLMGVILIKFKYENPI